MSDYAYVAVDPHGSETRGTLMVPDQMEAVRRIKEMGLFPMKVLALEPPRERPRPQRPARVGVLRSDIPLALPWFTGRVRTASLAVFTRQLATLVEAGMPLLRGLRTLQQQEEDRTLRRVIGDLSQAIENGSSMAEALSAHPRVFNRLYVNMVKAGEIGGALDVTLNRLAEFMEKAQKIKGKVKAALFYPCAVLLVAAAIVGVMMLFVVPRFKVVFDGLLQGSAGLPPFTLLVFKISDMLRSHALAMGLALVGVCLLFSFVVRTTGGRWAFDHLKLVLPVLGPVFRKAAISRFARTLGTLVSSGVPILQALTIVKETTGNVIFGRLVNTIHENVKQGDPIAPALKGSRLFPAMVAGMVDIGEQTGALPDLLMKIADTCDDEVDNAASAMTSLLEPIMIVFLAVVVGSIVIAMFLPILRLVDVFGGSGQRGEE